MDNGPSPGEQEWQGWGEDGVFLLEDEAFNCTTQPQTTKNTKTQNRFDVLVGEEEAFPTVEEASKQVEKKEGRKMPKMPAKRREKRPRAQKKSKGTREEEVSQKDIEDIATELDAHAELRAWHEAVTSTLSSSNAPRKLGEEKEAREEEAKEEELKGRRGNFCRGFLNRCGCQSCPYVDQNGGPQATKDDEEEMCEEDLDSLADAAMSTIYEESASNEESAGEEDLHTIDELDQMEEDTCTCLVCIMRQLDDQEKEEWGTLNLFEGMEDDIGDGDMLAHAEQSGHGRYVKFSSVMDSGSTDHVVNRSVIPEVPVKPSPGSRRGQVYSAAGGKGIPNEGEQVLPLLTNEGSAATLVYQVADVRRPLCSVARLCDRGNRVVFGAGGGIVQNRITGRCTPFHRDGSIYVLDLWYDIQTPFPRRG